VEFIAAAQANNVPIGVVGHSLGGQVALLTSVLTPLIRNTVISAGVTTMEACFDAGILHNPGWYMPNLQLYGDYPAIAPLFAGKNALFIAHQYDDYFPASGARDFFDALPKKGISKVWLNQPHAMTKESLDLIVEWFMTSCAVDAN